VNLIGVPIDYVIMAELPGLCRVPKAAIDRMTIL